MNTGIVEMLERMQRLRLEQGETGKVHGYTRAIRAAKTYPFQIVSGAQARSIPGVGPSMAARIEEFLTTGRVVELIAFEEKDKILKLFVSVDRVGLGKAEEWYRAGYRKLEDIPESACTRAQWIGLKLHGDLIQRIPRAEIDHFRDLFGEYMKSLGLYFEICGSYRRGKLESGDIDILVIDSRENTMEDVLKWPYLTHNLASGVKKFLGVLKLPGYGVHRRIDIELVQPHEYPYCVTYFTGPQSFNVKMRTYCEHLGLTLNEKHLLDPRGNPILVNSEEQLFQILGLQWLTPAERDAY